MRTMTSFGTIRSQFVFFREPGNSFGSLARVRHKTPAAVEQLEFAGRGKMGRLG